MIIIIKISKMAGVAQKLSFFMMGVGTGTMFLYPKVLAYREKHIKEVESLMEKHAEVIKQASEKVQNQF
jgi:hypothetical protein